MAQRVCVTGASGQAGRAVVADRREHGYDVIATDAVMNRPSAELLAEIFPGVKLTRDVGEFGTLLAIDRAREVLGFAPAHS